MSFIFGGDTGLSYDELQRRRREINSRRNRFSAPRDVGEGLTALGIALSQRLEQRRINKAAEAGAKRGETAFNAFQSILSGGSGRPTVSGDVPTGGQFAGSNKTMDLSGDKQEFINALLPSAIEESKRTGVDPRIIVGQAALETGWGRAAPGNNYFGIKSHGKGGGQTFTTHEVINGKRVKIRDSFRAYESPADSVRGYGDFILENPRYGDFRAAEGLDAQLDALQKSGYATDPRYGAKVGQIARSITLPEMPQAPVEVASADPQQALELAAGQSGAPAPEATPEGPPLQVAQNTGTRRAPLQATPTYPAAPNNAIDPRIFELMASQDISPGQRAVMTLMLQQHMKANAPIDPLKQLQIRKLQQEMNTPPDRNIIEGADGFKYYQDTGERVLPGVEKPNEQFRTVTGDDAAAMGLDPEKGYNLAPDGKLTQIGGNGTTVTIGEGDKFYDHLDRKNAETFATLSDGGITARGRLRRLDRLEILLGSTPQGMAAGIKQMLGDVGIATDGLDGIQATRAILEAMVPEQRPAGSGPMSDADIQMFRNSLPRVINQPGGNQLIMNTLRSVSEYEVQMGDIADRVADRDITPAEGRKLMRELENPLSGYREAVSNAADSSVAGGLLERLPGMTLDELQSLDASTMSAQELNAAAERYRQIEGGGQ